MTLVYILGIIAGIGTTVSFIPQVYLTMTNDKSDVSVGMISIQSAGTFCWMLYGVMMHDIIMIVFNSITFLLCVSILVRIMIRAVYLRQRECGAHEDTIGDIVSLP